MSIERKIIGEALVGEVQVDKKYCGFFGTRVRMLRSHQDKLELFPNAHPQWYGERADA